MPLYCSSVDVIAGSRFTRPSTPILRPRLPLSLFSTARGLSQQSILTPNAWDFPVKGFITISCKLSVCELDGVLDQNKVYSRRKGYQMKPSELS